MEAICTVFEEGLRSFEMLITPNKTRGCRVTASLGEENVLLSDFLTEDFKNKDFDNVSDQNLVDDKKNSGKNFAVDTEQSKNDHDSKHFSAETDPVNDDHNSPVLSLTHWNHTARNVETAAAKRMISTRDKRASLKDKE